MNKETAKKMVISHNPSAPAISNMAGSSESQLEDKNDNHANDAVKTYRLIRRRLSCSTVSRYAKSSTSASIFFERILAASDEGASADKISSSLFRFSLGPYDLNFPSNSVTRGAKIGRPVVISKDQVVSVKFVTPKAFAELVYPEVSICVCGLHYVGK